MATASAPTAIRYPASSSTSAPPKPARNDILAPRGRRLGFAEIAAAATVGRGMLSVYRQPHVAILPTGDEIVEEGQAPADFQIRNSNAYSLAAQVKRAGGVPHILPVARDTIEDTRALIERGLDADLLLMAGGVSAGKYDVVEPCAGRARRYLLL